MNIPTRESQLETHQRALLEAMKVLPDVSSDPDMVGLHREWRLATEFLADKKIIEPGLPAMIWPEKYRIRAGADASQTHDNYGAFFIQRGSLGLYIRAVEDTNGWDHVSVSLRKLNGKPLTDLSVCPAWSIMCMIKNLFWTKDSCVVQYHPAQADYVNIHPGVLHLWRYRLGEFPMPPKEHV